MGFRENPEEGGRRRSRSREKRRRDEKPAKRREHSRSRSRERRRRRSRDRSPNKDDGRLQMGQAPDRNPRPVQPRRSRSRSASPAFELNPEWQRLHGKGGLFDVQAMEAKANAIFDTQPSQPTKEEPPVPAPAPAPVRAAAPAALQATLKPVKIAEPIWKRHLDRTPAPAADIPKNCPPGYMRNFQGILVKIPIPGAHVVGGFPVEKVSSKKKFGRGSSGRQEREEKALLGVISMGEHAKKVEKQHGRAPNWMY